MNKQTDGQGDMQTNIKMIYGQASKRISKLTYLREDANRHLDKKQTNGKTNRLVRVG